MGHHKMCDFFRFSRSMLTPSDVLLDISPTCCCGALFDNRYRSLSEFSHYPFIYRLCSPHILPCSHTFCLMCLSKDSQRRKRRCPLCEKKYKTFMLNTALLGRYVGKFSICIYFADCVNLMHQIFLKVPNAYENS